jgi:hypothetical protein
LDLDSFTPARRFVLATAYCALLKERSRCLKTSRLISTVYRREEPTKPFEKR